jgi:hypothetical protein
MFYTGIALVAIAVVLLLIVCLRFWVHPPGMDGCLTGLMGMSVCTQCCGLAARLSNV